MNPKSIFISADHGLSLIYFLQTDLLPRLLEAGVHVVILTDDGLKERIAGRYNHPNLSFEGLRLKECREYIDHNAHALQYWLHFLRWMGGSKRVNTNAIDGHLRQMDHEASPRGKQILPFIHGLIYILRRSRLARAMLVEVQQRLFSPSLYADLIAKYQPGLVVASTPGWRLDRFLLREAASRRIKTAAVIVGWDNPSSYRLSGARVDYMNCWSEIQKEELIQGADWQAERVFIGGIPSYDGYFRNTWRMPRQDYYQLHNLDPNRKLIAYASSFVSLSPNYPNIAALTELIDQDRLDEPAQLLIRLHPNHFIPNSLYEQEANRVRELIRGKTHVHLVEPVPLGGEIGYYSGEDMPEKASMMAYADVFVTVYSTMVVETAIHDRPIVSACIDIPGGWNQPGKFSLSLSEIGNWPTHLRFREANAGRVAFDQEQLCQSINFYLRHPDADRQARQDFIARECTYTDGSAGERTAQFLLSILDHKGNE